MRKFYNLAGILSLSETDKELIIQQAKEGDPVASYKLAEIYLHLHECDDYISSAHELLQRASEGGVADADAEIAIMMFRGEIEPFDPVAAAKLLENAINNGSDLGAAFQIRNLLYGRYGYEQNIDLVKSTLEMLLSKDEDPYWCAFMGDVLMAEGKIVESQQWYEKAVAGGENSAYGDLALARGINDDYSFRDYEAYNDTLMEGNDAMDPMCMYYFILDKIESYYDIDPEDTQARDEYRQMIIHALELTIEWHHPMSMELLGDIYREGKIDIPVDLLKAWEYYVHGSEFMHASCFGKMYDMLQANENPKFANRALYIDYGPFNDLQRQNLQCNSSRTIVFEEDHENPPSRAYLKIQESLTMANLLNGTPLPKGWVSRVLPSRR